MNKMLYEGIIINLWGTCNYGAILTAYAIQNIFRLKGYNYALLNYIPWEKDNYIGSKFESFANKYLKLTHEVNTIKDFNCLNSYTNTFVVGSDQVFRYKYIAKLYNIFTLAFTDMSKKRIAFSASFGTDDIEADEYETYEIKKRLKRFDAISTREISGVNLCKDTFDINAIHLLDPVFLLDKNKYIEEIIDKDLVDKYKNKIIYYILDKSPEIEQILNELKEQTGLQTIDLLENNLSVEEWLTALYAGKYILTDSFHGSCFAIIFEKNFKCLINNNRGSSRFHTLIEVFNIPENFVTIPDNLRNIDINNEKLQNNISSIIESECRKMDRFFEIYIKNEKEYSQENYIHELEFLRPLMTCTRKKIIIKNTFLENIFSLKNQIIGNIKYKILTILFIKIKFKKL